MDHLSQSSHMESYEQIYGNIGKELQNEMYGCGDQKIIQNRLAQVFILYNKFAYLTHCEVSNEMIKAFIPVHSNAANDICVRMVYYLLPMIVGQSKTTHILHERLNK